MYLNTKTKILKLKCLFIEWKAKLKEIDCKGKLIIKRKLKWKMSTGVKRALPKQGYSPDLNKYVTKKLRIKLNGGREIEGVVVGVDVFMNVALERAFEIINGERKVLYKVVVRGNSILMWELLEKVVSWVNLWRS